MSNTGDVFGDLKRQDTETEVIIGSGSETNATGTVSIGDTAVTNANNSVAIGANTSTAKAGEVVIGGDQVRFGATQGTLANSDLNNGQITFEIDEANTQIVIKAKDSGGTVTTGTVPLS